jgi:hypothetical protein
MHTTIRISFYNLTPGVQPVHAAQTVTVPAADELSEYSAAKETVLAEAAERGHKIGITGGTWMA